MENFVVSARKYRPITFESVVGQSHITTTLKNAIRTNHLAQAFLFCGPRGVGKTTCARILAKTINCQNLSADAEACGTCESCQSFQNNASFNIHELDAASNNSVDDIRSLIDQVRYPPQSGKYKIYIIDEVHMLSTSAFNAFLKTLEEPPSYAIFILATTEKHKILPTILSRCQIFDFNRIQIRDMTQHLANIAQKEGITADNEALELIAQKADGGLRDALSMFDLNVTFSKDGVLHYADVLENLHILDYDYYFKMTDALTTGNQSDAFILFDEILQKGFDGHQFVIGLLEHFRNLLVCKDAATVRLMQVSDHVQQKYLTQSAATSLSFLASALSLGSACDINYKAAKNQKLHVEISLLKMANLSHLFHVATLPSEDEKKKPNLNGGTETKERRQENGDGGMETGTGNTNSQFTNSQLNTQNSELKTPPTTSALRSTINLGAKPKEEANLVVQEPVIQQNIPFDKTKLQASWDKFVAFLESKERYSEVVILKRNFTLEDTTIHLAVDNALQTDLLKVSMRTELLNYLRKDLSNSHIHLEVTIAEQEVKTLIYTQAEKFKFLAEKNPAMLELKSVLGLDYDY